MESSEWIWESCSSTKIYAVEVFRRIDSYSEGTIDDGEKSVDFDTSYRGLIIIKIFISCSVGMIISTFID